MENPNFLKQKYNLHSTPEVENAAKRTQVRTGEKVPQKPEARIQNYLDRFEEIIERKDPDKRQHGIDALKRLLYSKFVINPEEIPESYFDTQRRLAREQGHGDIEITDEAREQLTEVIIADQRSTLDNWVDYLSSEDATYPDWLKYYAFRNVLNIGEYDKEKKQFTKRSKGTVKPFPDLNREALAYVLDAIEKKQAGIKTIPPIDIETDKEDYKKFEKFLQGENFLKLYAWAIDKVTPASVDQLTNTKGEWIKYDRNSDHMPLVQSLQGHGTGWCTAGESTAEAQLKGGDFYVYYSLDQDGQARIPRAAIRMQEGSIAEVRGIAHEQNLDPHINDIVKKKLTEFPDGQAYEKKTEDMKRLTEIGNKSKKGDQLTKEDLVFLYEIDQSIEGFGYQRDPRIDEIRKSRNSKEDAPIIFECQPEEIANRMNDINENTKAYIGALEKGIFSLVEKYNIEHVYTSFPEGKTTRFEAEMGGISEEEIISELEAREQLPGSDRSKIYVGNYGKSMLKNRDSENGFHALKNKERIKFVKLKVSDLGFPTGATTKEIYKRAEELGLELCPQETGPQLRLHYEEIFKKEQPRGEFFRIAMKQISDSDGLPSVFRVYRHEDGESWLDFYWARPELRWPSAYEFVFRLRKFEV